MKIILSLILSILFSTYSYAVLTPGYVPVVKTGGTNTTTQNGSITDTGTSSGPGNVGIGSTNPQGTLDVSSGTICLGHVCDAAWPSGGGGGSGTVSSGTIGKEAVYTGTTTVSSGIITDNGTNVGVGSSNPGMALDVNGTGRFTAVNTAQLSNFNTNGLLRLGSSNGSLSVDTNTYLQSTGNGSSLTNIPTSISNSDGTLTISPTTGTSVASIALGHANVWTGQQTFNTSAPILGTVTASTPLFVNGSNAIVSGSVSGSTTKLATVNGALTNGHLASIDTLGNFVDSGISAIGASQWNTSGSNIYVSTYNVGIGTSLAPASLLDVAKNVSIGTAYAGYVAAPTNGMIVQGNVGIGTSSAITTPLVVNGQITALGVATSLLNPNGGNVGIGTATTNATLDINGSFKLESNGAGSGYVLTSNGVGIGTWMPSSGGSGTPGGSSPQLQYNNAGSFGGLSGSAVVGGNVGIGSVNPNYNLNVAGSGAQIGVLNTVAGNTSNINFISDTGKSSGIGMGGSTNSSFGNIGYAGTYGAYPFQLMTNSSPVITLSGSNVGIGSVNPTQVLDVNGTIKSSATGNSTFGSNVGIGTTLSTNALDIATGGVTIGTTYAGYKTAPSNGLIVQGNIGIGTPTSGYALTIFGNVGIGTTNSATVQGVTGSGGTSCLCKAFVQGICTSLGTCT